MHQNTAATPKIPQDSMLVLLVKLIDRIQTRPISPPNECVRTHPDGSIIKGPLTWLDVVTENIKTYVALFYLKWRRLGETSEFIWGRV